MLLLAPSPPPPALQVVSGVEGLMAVLKTKSHHRPLVVHFWATWCATCMAELPKIQRLARALEGSGADLALVSLDPPSEASEAAGALAQAGLLGSKHSYGVVLDAPEPAPVAAQFNPRWSGELPATFFLLESGAVVASHLGPTPVDTLLGEVQAHIKALQPKALQENKP